MVTEHEFFRLKSNSTPSYQNDYISQMMRSLMSEELAHVVPFDEEYKNECTKKNVNTQLSKTNAHYLAEIRSSLEMMPMQTDSLLEMLPHQQEPLHFMKRYGVKNGEHFALIRNFLIGNPQLGDLIPVPSDLPHFKYLSKHNFRNVSSPVGLDLTQAECVVGIGFCDLFDLLDAEYADDSQKPLAYHGFEANPFNVAKFTSVVEMLRDTTVPLYCILQVWYSSAWSKETTTIFKRKCRNLLKQEDINATERVRSYWKLWSSPLSKVTLKHARTQWREFHPPTCNIAKVPAFLKRREDRIAYIDYLLNGEIGGDVNTGSLCMYMDAEKQQQPPEESIFLAIPTDGIIAEMQNKVQKKGHRVPIVKICT
uniref:Uncharacterized protein n=1 Tax=Percolomonas cosmopolitus TaxID=63605 RepID=A0A7S1KRN9_9EUKA